MTCSFVDTPAGVPPTKRQRRRWASTKSITSLCGGKKCCRDGASTCTHDRGAADTSYTPRGHNRSKPAGRNHGEGEGTQVGRPARFAMSVHAPVDGVTERDTCVPTIMPLLIAPVNEVNKNDDDSDEDSSDEDTGCSALKRVKHLEGTLAAVSSNQFERLPCPMIVDSGAAENVLPVGWCPQAELVKGAQEGKLYAAANGSTIKNKGFKIVSAVTK